MLRPTREVERRLLRRHTLVAGIDEVGRGALAGPVSVGVAVVGRATRPRFPDGLADSKLLPAATREHLCAPIRAWVAGAAVGHASPAEIDAVGIVAALRLAAVRALIHVRRPGCTRPPRSWTAPTTGWSPTSSTTTPRGRPSPSTRSSCA